jgi:predicted alpha/beta-hydrolase family hydrolase
MEASWAVGYTDLKSLKAASDVAIEGTIAAVAGETVAENIPFTDFTLSIHKVVYDPHGRIHGTTVLVHQTGGIVNNTLNENSDDQLFRVGEQVVLFLHEYDPGKYFVEGGPTGRFEVRSGIVSAASTDGMAVPPSTSIDAFLANVRTA